MNESTTVDFNGKEFIVTCPFWDNNRAKMAPDRIWDKGRKAWIMPPIGAIAKYLEREFTATEFEPAALSKIKELKNTGTKTSTFPSWYRFKNDPMKHQKECLNKAWGKEEFAMFMWMGRGKTFTLINLASAYAMDGKINAVLIVCISGVKPVWPVEWEEHGTIPASFHIMEAGKYKKTTEFIESDAEFKVMVVGVEALSQGNAYKYVEQFCLSHNVMMGIDESSSIKNPFKKAMGGAKAKGIRTGRCWHLGGLSKYRVIMTGTEVTEGVENLFSQYRFLNWQIIGHKSYFTFTARYCIFGGFENRQIIEYQNMKELMDAIEPYTFSIGKDVEGLPPKIYKPPIVVKATSAQNKAMAELKEQEYTEVDGKELITETVLERTMRYQQICGGFFPFDIEGGGHDTIPIPGKNPKLDALLGIIEDSSPKQQVIIWAKFIPELELIVENLKRVYGEESVAEYRGGSSTDERIQIIKNFQAGNTRFLVSNKTGAFGITITAATLAIYYSNDFSYETRIQSEERCHRKGQENSVTYIDIIIDHPIEKKIIKALSEKKSLAEYVKEELGAYKH